MASNYPDEAPRSSPWRTALIVAGLAFLAGLALMAWALTRWEPAKRLVSPSPATGNVAQLADPAPAAIVATPQLALPSQGQAASIDLRVTDLEGRIARIDLRAAAAAGNAARAEGLLIAFAARRAIDRGVALGYVEGQLRDRFGQTQPRAVAAVISAAQTPVTIEGLKQGLDALAPALASGTKTESWWDATRRSLGTLIVVRREGSSSPAPDERLARARLRLDSGQVDGALAEIARLPGRASAAEWMAAARRHIEAHRALDLIEAAAIMPPPAQPGATAEF